MIDCQAHESKHHNSRRYQHEHKEKTKKRYETMH